MIGATLLAMIVTFAIFVVLSDLCESVDVNIYIIVGMIIVLFGLISYHLGEKAQKRINKIEIKELEKVQRCLPLTYNKDLGACVDVKFIQKLEEVDK